MAYSSLSYNPAWKLYVEHERDLKSFAGGSEIECIVEKRHAVAEGRGDWSRECRSSFFVTF